MRPIIWTQQKWSNSDVALYRNSGDYDTLSGLIPDQHRLKRAPAWSAQVDVDTNGLTDVRGMFYDRATERYVLVGSNASADLTAAYLSSTFVLSANTQLHATPTNLAGLSQRNLMWWGDYLWLIGSDQKIYRGASYTGALAEFDSSVDHRIIVHAADRAWNFKDNGLLQRINSANDAFANFATNYVDYDARAMVPMRGYLLIAAKAAEGAIQLLRVPSDWASFQELASVAHSGEYPAAGCLFVVHGGSLFFSPGYSILANGDLTLDILRFNGSTIEKHNTITHAPNSGTSGIPTSAGLGIWRGELLYWALAGSTQQIFKLVSDSQVTDLPDLSASVDPLSHPLAQVLGDRIIATADDGAEGIHHLGGDSLADGYLVSSWLDFKRSGELKRLLEITVTLDSSATDFDVVIKYRVDDETDWTTATTADGTAIITAADLDTFFHKLQYRIELDDNTGNDEDISITSIAVTYTRQ